MIYKLSFIKRLASEMLCDDIKKNRTFTFTNASYGGNGTVLGTIVSEDIKGEEHMIQYVLTEDYKTEESKLIKYTKDRYFSNATRPYSCKENSETLMTLYNIKDNIYTDSKNEFLKAAEIRNNRYCNKSYYKSSTTLSKSIKPNTNLYDRLYDYIINNRDGKSIKYGTEICLVRTSYRTKDYYGHPTTRVEADVQFVYRGRSYCITKSKYSLDW